MKDPLICPRCDYPVADHTGYGVLNGCFIVEAGRRFMACHLTEAEATQQAQRALGLKELKYLRGQRDAYRALSGKTADSFHMESLRVLDVLRLLRVAKSVKAFWGKRK